MIRRRKNKYDSRKVLGVKSIIINDINVRFLLSITTKAMGKPTILVIMKNPSQATDEQSDKTINNVIDNLYMNYSQIYIMNLFPYYSTKANGLLSYFDKADYDSIIRINDVILSYYSLKANDILLGWGTNTIGMKKADYDRRIKQIMTIIGQQKKKIYYVHCCCCDQNHDGCSNGNEKCTCRCIKHCVRRGHNTVHGTIRYPMHLELWTEEKSMVLF